MEEHIIGRLETLKQAYRVDLPKRARQLIKLLEQRQSSYSIFLQCSRNLKSWLDGLSARLNEIQSDIGLLTPSGGPRRIEDGDDETSVALTDGWNARLEVVQNLMSELEEDTSRQKFGKLLESKETLLGEEVEQRMLLKWQAIPVLLC
ncbi:unnamed protein product [Protopolystoma xenopodis]|uniref:Uncharacterized protein n=1 Tax=Protopolystoma xenopodis TaxID=117903 RepID=A0A448XQ54_9PLAT|nr:unnamed protein product [Protopolystoma xenopodis]